MDSLGRGGYSNGGGDSPVSLASAERAEENADVNRPPLIRRRRPGGGTCAPCTQGACAAVPLWPAAAGGLYGWEGLFRRGGTTWPLTGAAPGPAGELRPAAPARPCRGSALDAVWGGSPSHPLPVTRAGTARGIGVGTAAAGRLSPGLPGRGGRAEPGVSRGPGTGPGPL